MRLADCDIFRIPVGPGSIHVERYGYGGGAVVLLHGFGTSSFLWRRIAPELALAQNTAFALDLLGYGASDRPVDADFGVRSQALYLERALSALGLARPTIVGCDIGAVIALRLAFDDPNRVSRLVLVSPSEIHELPGPHIRLMQRQTAKHVFTLARGLFGAEPLVRALLETSLSDPSSLTPLLVGRFVAPYLGRQGVNHLLALARALEEDDLEDLSLAAIQHPTLVLRGTADRWCTEAHAQLLQAELPNARIESISEAGRLLGEERPEVLSEAILAHLAVEAPGPETEATH